MRRPHRIARGAPRRRRREPLAWPAVVYVEGARDRDILEGWAHALSPQLARGVRDASVILGGRQPARAREHFAERRRGDPTLCAVCVLDRDDGLPSPVGALGPGLELFTWSRRHIESYLLVPAAIRRGLRTRDPHGRLGRALREHLPDAADEPALARLDAKRLLGPEGPIVRALGRPLALGRIARATREEEMHEDVCELLTRIATLLGLPASAPHAIRRAEAPGPRG